LLSSSWPVRVRAPTFARPVPPFVRRAGCGGCNGKIRISPGPCRPFFTVHVQQQLDVRQETGDVLTKKVVVEIGKEMMNNEQGISNVEVIVRVLFLHHSSLTSSSFASLFDIRHSIKSKPSLSVQLMSSVSCLTSHV
jgi:hypothetical protein